MLRADIYGVEFFTKEKRYLPAINSRRHMVWTMCLLCVDIFFKWYLEIYFHEG